MPMDVERLKCLALRGDENAAKALGPIARRKGDDSLLMWRAICSHSTEWHHAESARSAYHGLRSSIRVVQEGAGMPWGFPKNRERVTLAFEIRPRPRIFRIQRRMLDGWRDVATVDRSRKEDPLIRRHMSRRRSTPSHLRLRWETPAGHDMAASFEIEDTTKWGMTLRSPLPILPPHDAVMIFDLGG